ncbi:MAG: protein translocase subunit SecD, partial [Nocardioides sp.]
MSRGALVRFLLVLGLLGGCLALTLNTKPNLGLDLRGGAQFVFQATGTGSTEATAENVDKTVEVLRGRVDALGVAESTLARQGTDRILVELPGVSNDEEAQAAEERIGQTARLSVHPVVATVASADAKPSKKGNLVVPDEGGSFIEIGPTALEGEEITGANAATPQNGVGWEVNVDFSSKGSDAFGKLSATAACATGDPNRIAMVLDGKSISSPSVNVACGGNITNSTAISGNFSQTEAQDLAALIEGGALPLELELISDRLVGPTLGAEAIDASIEAGIIGLLLTG